MADEEKPTEEESESNDDGPAYGLATIGGGIGFAVGGAPGAAACTALGWIVGNIGSIGPREDTDHDRTLVKAASLMDEAAQEHASNRSRLWLAHVDGLEHGLDAEAGGTGTQFEDMDMEPDIIYYDVGGPTTTVLIEVETQTGIENDQQHAADQLDAFARPGYALALVMPSDEVAWAEEWVAERDDVDEDRVHVVAADAMGEFISP